MSEQGKILAELQEVIMGILKTGAASVEEGNRIDELEDLLMQQKCFKEIDHPEHANQGEEIAALFFNDAYTEAIEKMCAWEITPEDFFGFVDYHYDEDEDEAIEMFTDAFIADVTKVYQSTCKAKEQ